MLQLQQGNPVKMNSEKDITFQYIGAFKYTCQCCVIVNTCLSVHLKFEAKFDIY